MIVVFEVIYFLLKADTIPCISIIEKTIIKIREITPLLKDV